MWQSQALDLKTIECDASLYNLEAFASWTDLPGDFERLCTELSTGSMSKFEKCLFCRRLPSFLWNDFNFDGAAAAD